MNKSTLKVIMQKAWHMVKEFAMSMSEALHKAWMQYKAKDKMLTSVVTIKFQKKDGTIRMAHATLCPSLIPVSTPYHPTHTRKSNDNVQVYWDVDKQSFRSYINSNLIRIL